MKDLIEKVKLLEKSEIGNTVEQRLAEFAAFKDKPGGEWFSELCFCILTANSKQKTGASIQKELGPRGFLSKSQEEIRDVIIRNRHRFHNNKSRYIVEARKHARIKDIINDIVRTSSVFAAREWLAGNINGLGYKEASHFLRNTGHEGVAILDRHILSILKEYNIISEIPRPVNKNNYIKIEEEFINLSIQLDMSPAKLDLLMWHMKTGEVLK